MHEHKHKHKRACFFFVLFFRQWITYTCICFLMAYNARPCVKELSAAADLKPAVPEYKEGRAGTWEMRAADFSFTVWVRISKVAPPHPFPRALHIVAGYYKSNATQGTWAL